MLPAMDAPLRARSYVPLALQATGTGAALSLFAAQGVAATAPQANGARSDSVPLVRLKRKADAEVKTISVERSTKKALHEELAALAVAEKQASAGNAATSASPATTPQRKLYRRVASYSARSFQNAQGAENLLERIYIKNEEVAQREAGRTSLRRRQDAQRERAKQQQTASHRQQGPVQPTLPTVEVPAKALPVSTGKHPTRAELEAQEKHIIMNCMPLVREYLQIERQKAEESAKKKLTAHLSGDAEMGKMLDEYEVEVFEAVPDGVVMTDAAVAETVMVTLAPFEDRDPLVYDHELDSSDNENGDEEDSNDEDHPNNDYPDDPEDDSDAEKDSDASSEEDVWAAPSRRERYVQDVDDDD